MQLSSRSPNSLKRIVLVGLGNVSNKVHPAILNLLQDGSVTDVLYVDKKPGLFPKFKNDGITCQQLDNPEDAPAMLAKSGFLGTDVLCLICTPDQLHVPYCEALADVVGHVAIEKPLALSTAEAKRLLKLGGQCSAIEHQLNKESSLKLIGKFKEQQIEYTDLRRMNFTMHESGPVGERELAPLSFDTGYHGLALGLAALRHQVEHLEIVVKKCFVATYANGPDKPRNSTAALIRGEIIAEWSNIPFEVDVAKGVRISRKRFAFRGQKVNHRINLDESGYRPHCRVIRTLLRADSPSISIEDSIQVVSACETANKQAIDCGSYEFGTNIDWQSLAKLSPHTA